MTKKKRMLAASSFLLFNWLLLVSMIYNTLMQLLPLGISVPPFRSISLSDVFFTYTRFKFVHHINIESMSVFALNVKLHKLRDSSELQPENIERISVTFDVLKLLKSSDLSELQKLNIWFIFVTFDVLKLLKSSDSSELQE